MMVLLSTLSRIAKKFVSYSLIRACSSSSEWQVITLILKVYLCVCAGITPFFRVIFPSIADIVWALELVEVGVV